MRKLLYRINALVEVKSQLEKKNNELRQQNQELKEKILEYQKIFMQEQEVPYIQSVQSGQIQRYFQYKNEIESKLEQIRQLNAKCSQIYQNLLFKNKHEPTQNKSVPPSSSMIPQNPQQNNRISVKPTQSFSEQNGKRKAPILISSSVQVEQKQSINLRKLTKIQKLEQKKSLKQNKMEKRKSQQPVDKKDIEPNSKNLFKVNIGPEDNTEKTIHKNIPFTSYTSQVFSTNNHIYGQRYGPISIRTRNIDRENKNIQYSSNSYQLNHMFTDVKIESFVKSSWTNFELMRFCNSKFGDHEWRKFIDHIPNYPNVKLLLLNNNDIKHVTFEDLQKLKNIKYINFRENPLSEDSIEAIKQFKREHQGAIKIFP